jgi:protein-ribulosamine 3-kinase
MMIPDPVDAWLEEHGHGRIIASHSVGGGCINNGVRLSTDSGTSFFLKTNYQCPEDMFEREAKGLQALSIDGAPRVPKAYHYSTHFLLMEDLRPAPLQEDYWEVFGCQMAVLHSHINQQFGFAHDNYCGATPQPNPWTQDGHKFFGEQRLLYQARMATRRGLLERREMDQVRRLVDRLPELVPVQPASLLHGDLWTGNAISDENGAPALIDPAAHFGWAEAELAMTTLFGAFPKNFYSAYQAVRPLAPGFTERFDLYNLYHLLNHLNLFGAGYLSQVTSVLRRYR